MFNLDFVPHILSCGVSLSDSEFMIIVKSCE